MATVGSYNQFSMVLTLLFLWFLCSCETKNKSYRSQSWCDKEPNLSSRQSKLCKRIPGLQVAIKEGLDMGLSECKRLFRRNRWNCTLLVERGLVLHRAPDGTKEAAFTTALMSSALAYSAAKACVKKEVTECSCEPVKRPPAGRKTWTWRGCSVNIRYGSYLAERFIMSEKNNRSSSNTMTKHNVRVGLEVLKESRLIICSLGRESALKSCHIVLPPFTEISGKIKAKYFVATKVIPVQRNRRQSYYLRTTGRHRGRPNGKRPKKTSLVFLDRSPSYCYRQDSYNIPGTRGRRCRRNSDKEDDCSLLCCGRGYKRRRLVKERSCLCKRNKDKTCSCQRCTDVILENICL